MNLQLRWKQVGDDYELKCPCCASTIAMIFKREGVFEGQIYIKSRDVQTITGKTSLTVRREVNRRVEELLNK